MAEVVRSDVEVREPGLFRPGFHPLLQVACAHRGLVVAPGHQIVFGIGAFADGEQAAQVSAQGFGEVHAVVAFASFAVGGGNVEVVGIQRGIHVAHGNQQEFADAQPAGNQRGNNVEIALRLFFTVLPDGGQQLALLGFGQIMVHACSPAGRVSIRGWLPLKLKIISGCPSLIISKRHRMPPVSN